MSAISINFINRDIKFGSASYKVIKKKHKKTTPYACGILYIKGKYALGHLDTTERKFLFNRQDKYFSGQKDIKNKICANGKKITYFNYR